MLQRDAKKQIVHRSSMRTAEQISELEGLLARQRMILEQLRQHLEGLIPHTTAANQAGLRIADTLHIIRSLEAKKYALCRQAGMPVIH
jgi:hypothetical protein